MGPVRRLHLAHQGKQISRGLGEEVTPGHIPNPEVKLFSADGTAGATQWESRSPRDPFKAKASLLDHMV